MGKFEEYAKKNSSIEKQEFYTEEKQKGFPSRDLPEPMSVTGLADKFTKRVQYETTFEERTRYYFEDYKEVPPYGFRPEVFRGIRVHP